MTTAQATHECAAGNCGKQVNRELLMCKWHWSRVPAGIQRMVYKTWREGPTSAYLEWRQKAIAAVAGT